MRRQPGQEAPANRNGYGLTQRRSTGQKDTKAVAVEVVTTAVVEAYVKRNGV